MGGFVAGGAVVRVRARARLCAVVRGCAYICDPSFFMRCVLALRVVCAYISCLICINIRLCVRFVHFDVCCMGACTHAACCGKINIYAGVAELADAYASGAYEGSLVKVQVLSPAPFPLLPALACAVCMLLATYYLPQNRSNHFRRQSRINQNRPLVWHGFCSAYAF